MDKIIKNIEEDLARYGVIIAPAGPDLARPVLSRVPGPHLGIDALFVKPRRLL